MPTKLFSRLKDEAKIEKFLDNFYQTSIDTLLKPILDIPEPNHCTGNSNVLFSLRQRLTSDLLVVQNPISSSPGNARTFIYLYATCYPLSLCNIHTEVTSR